MTPNGKLTLRILCDLWGEQASSTEPGITAQEITEEFPGLENRNKPVMTVSSYLTHLKRLGFVEREVSSDKTIAWWRPTDKGRKANAQEGQAASDSD